MGLWAAVVIVEALDIVLFDIFAVLNFDDLKRNLLRVLEAVFRVDGNIRAFICMDQVCLPLSGHPRRPCHHHPVLAPPSVELKTQPRLRA